MASLRDLLRLPAGPVNLDDFETGATPQAPAGKKGTKADLEARTDEMRELQDRLMAEGSQDRARRRLLVVLQGMDASGKGGTVKHVFSRLNLTAVHHAAFKKPTHEELERHFLWRVRKQVPEPGEIGVWDRSHYEDVLVARVRGLVPREVWQLRYEEINAFERELAGEGVVLLKVFLHISFREQCERMRQRLEDPTKRWKFNPRDIDERDRWGEYRAAYEALLERCNTDVAPWYLVPADRKWYRNWAVQTLLLETLREMDPRYPLREDIDDAEFRDRLSCV